MKQYPAFNASSLHLPVLVTIFNLAKHVFYQDEVSINSEGSNLLFVVMEVCSSSSMSFFHLSGYNPSRKEQLHYSFFFFFFLWLLIHFYKWRTVHMTVKGKTIYDFVGHQ